MDSIVLYSGAVFDLPSRFSSNKQLKLGKPLFSIRDGTLVCGSAKDDSVHSSVPITNSDRRDKVPSQQVADGRKHEEILALLRRIRSSIASVEAANLQNRKAILSNEPSKQLKDGIAKKEEKVVKRKQPVAKKDQKLQNNGQSPALDFKATRLPSSFSKRSPIPSWTDPRGKNPSGGDNEASTFCGNNDSKNQKLQIVGQSSELDFRSSRLPSNFLKRSPIPSLTKPNGNNPFGEKDETSAFSSNDKVKEMKVAELKKLAKTRGIKGYSKLKKSELLEMLS